MNFYKHHLGDYAAATSHLSWDEDCAYRRLIDQYYKREAPIPIDLKEACRLVRATTPAQRRAVETVLREYFEQQAEGWRQKRCDEEIAEAEEQGTERSAKQENERERQRRHREERKKLFEQLRLLDIVPSWDTKTDALRAMLAANHVTPIERDMSQPVTPPVTRTATAIHKPLAISHKPDTKVKTVEAARRGSRLPADWVLTPELEAYCRSERPDLDPMKTAERFRDFWVSKAGQGGVKLDWAATWRNWVRNEKAPMQNGRANGHSGDIFGNGQ